MSRALFLFLLTLGSQYALHAQSSRFIPIPPCRVVDTRNAAGPFGGPRMVGNTSRSFSLPLSPCGLPANSQAYSLNITVVPPGPLFYLTIWPTGQPQPGVSTLNSFEGKVVANAAIVPAGVGGEVSVFVSNNTDVIIDVNGYFDTNAAAALPFFTLPPCRIADTRNAAGAFGGPALVGGVARSFPIPSSACNLPASAKAYSLNATVVPPASLSFLTLWPTGQAQPGVSTLNSFDGRIVANAALAPAGTGGAIQAFGSNNTDLILDANGYFADTGAGTALSFFPVAPCRIADTRNPNGAFGGPRIEGGNSRSFNVTQSNCGVPAAARAYSLNVTAVPAGPLPFLTLWPSDQARPVVSTLNSFQGSVVANAAIVPAAADGSVSVFMSSASDVILDINGYFAPAQQTLTPDFSLTATPATRGIAQGASTTYTATITSQNGFNSPVSLSLLNTPAGLTATFNPATVTPTANGTATSTLTISTTSATAASVYNLNVRATSGTVVKNQDISLTVSASTSTQNTEILISNFSFNPTPVVVPAGGQVIWRNNDIGIVHTVVAAGNQFASGLIAGGDTFTTVPTTPGIYNYRCTLHPLMSGTIVVQ